MTLPIQTIIGTHEALADWRFTAQEANQVITSVWEGVIGAVVLAAMTGVFSMVVSKNPGDKNPGEKLPTPTVSEIYDNVTVSIPDIRAVAELSVLGPSGVSLYGLDPDNWLWFNRLINQSGIPRVGTLLLDAVLNYCKEKNYSILNQVNAYGDVSQKELEGWYIRKGFTPVDYGKYGNALLKWTPPQTNPGSVKLYHCTDASNVGSIMRNGLLSYESEMVFLFPNLEVAEEAGLSGMAILEVSITDDEIDKCIIGETFPDLYIGRYGGEPPADTSLREYIRNPIAYGIPEVCCTISKIPANRIKHVKTIRR